jgi:creatinine amidohydrolase/Fe(II)-dependent formamide hydrolase-like protein
MREVRWERMFPDELEAAFSARPVVWFAYGLCEPHGPQNALGLDALKAHGIACRAAREHGGIVAPPDFWHVHDIAGCALWGMEAIGEVERKWLTAVPPWVHFRNVCYHVRAAEVLRAHAAIFVTGHYGPNWKDLKKLLELAQPRVGTRLYGLPDFEANTPGFDRDGQSGGDHAGKVETSLMMAVDAECSDLTRLPPQMQVAATGPTPWAMGRDAYRADRRTGERMVDDEVAFLGSKTRELLAEYDRLRPRHSFTSFDEVEGFWTDVVSPRVKDFECMALDFSGKGRSVPASSVWRESWNARYGGAGTRA